MKRDDNYLKKELYELIKSDERIFDFIQESSLDGMWYWDLEQPENEWMNPKFWTTLGYDPKEMPHKASAWQDIINPDDLNTALENFHKHVKDPEHPYDQLVRYTHKNGTTVWIRCRGLVIRNEEGGAIRMLGAHHDVTDVKRAEEKLKQEHKKVVETEELYRFITENTSDVILYQTPKGEFFYISPNIKELTGYTAEEYNKFGPLENVLETDYYILQQAIKEIEFGTDTLNVEYRIKHKAGHIIWLQSRVKAIRDDNGKVISLISSANDITYRKKTEQKLKKSEIYYKQLVETAVDAIYLINSQGIVIDANQKASVFLDKKRDEIVGQKVSIIDPNFSVESFIQFWEPVPFNEPLIFETSHKDKSGKVIPMEISGKKFLLDDETYYYGIARDISERKKAENELIHAKEKAEESETRFRALHNASFGGITIHDKGIILDCNKGLSEITGYIYQELIGMNGLLLIEPSHRDFVMSQIQSGCEESYEVVGVRKNGELYPLRLEARNIPYKGKQVRSVEFRDVTQQKIYEKQLIEAKEKAELSDRLKTEFLNNMSHEIRTPMNGILGFSKFLSKPDLTDVKRETFVNIIQNSSNQLLHIIDDILEISKLETKQVKVIEKEVCLNSMLFKLFSLFQLKANEKNISLYVRKGLSDKEGTILTDEIKLNKIISNLLDNAIKFSNEGVVEFGYKLVNMNVIFYVKDDGIGIEPENHALIFERFSQEEKELSQSKGGLGLGLSIAKENAKLLGGEITLKSKKGEGATFHLTLPYRPALDEIAEEKKKKVSKGALKKRYQGKTILVAEDEEMNFLYLETLINTSYDLDCKILHAKNGKEAVDIYRNNAIDLVFMDLKMPVLNGFEATRQLKDIKPELPIIAQTAYTLDEDKSKAFKAGCDGFISKPIDEYRLLRILDKYLK